MSAADGNYGLWYLGDLTKSISFSNQIPLFAGLQESITTNVTDVINSNGETYMLITGTNDQGYVDYVDVRNINDPEGAPVWSKSFEDKQGYSGNVPSFRFNKDVNKIIGGIQFDTNVGSILYNHSSDKTDYLDDLSIVS